MSVSHLTKQALKQKILARIDFGDTKIGFLTTRRGSPALRVSPDADFTLEPDVIADCDGNVAIVRSNTLLGELFLSVLALDAA